MSAAAGDPLLLAGAAAALSLFPRTLGPASAVSAASPSKVHETLLRDISQSLLQKGSKEMVEQASQAIKSHGDIRKLYQDDGAKAAMVNGKNNNQGRRPALGRKRAPFSLKITTSDSVQNVDFSVLENIDDPEEYFLAVERLEKADKEMKRLRGGEVPTESVENHQTRKERKSRPGILGRKSVYSYQFSVGDDISNAFEGPASQRGTSTQSRFIEEDLNVLSPENAKQLVTSSSSQPELPGASERKDPISEKDSGITLDHLLSSFKNLDEVEEENLLREILQLKETSRGKVCLPEFNIPGDRPLGSIASWNNPISGRTPERPISGSHLARISKLERRISLGDALKDNYVDISKDDDSEGSPEIVRDKQSPRAHSSSDEIVLMTGETSTAKVMDEERPNESVGSPEHALGPEQNILNDVMIGERQAGNSPIGVYIARAVSKEKNAFDGHNFSLEGDGVPLDSLIIEKSSNKTEVSSSHNLRANSTEALASARCRNVDPGSRPDTGRTSHAVDDNSQNEVPVAAQKVVEGDDKATCPLEIPPADIDPENQPHMQDENIEQQQQTVGTSNALSPSIGKKQKAAQKGRNKKKKELNGRKSLSDAGLVWQSGVRRSTRVRSRPLQDWLGERFLYGRIHNTMATVIGVKSYSPSQDGKKPTMRVKSFVSEQYADLVAQAAKY